MKALLYQFGEATVSGFRNHSHVPRRRTNKPKSTRKYLFDGTNLWKEVGVELLSLLEEVFLMGSVLNSQKYHLLLFPFPSVFSHQQLG